MKMVVVSFTAAFLQVNYSKQQKHKDRFSMSVFGVWYGVVSVAGVLLNS